MGYQHFYNGTGRKYLVKCLECGWKGYRKDSIQCECYEDWAMYCRADAPGPGCPRGIVWPCPKHCGSLTYRQTRNSKVVIVREVFPKSKTPSTSN